MRTGPLVPLRSRSIAARIWWATLPYYGWTDGYPNPENPAPWYAYPLAWLNRLATKAPGFEAFEPTPPIVCNCDYCRGVPGARLES